MSHQITSQPVTEPITLAEARSQLRAESETFDDTFITELIKEARSICEGYCNRVFITQTWRQNESRFGAYIDLAVSPVISVTSVKYVDTAEVQQTLPTANYQVDLLSDTGSIFEGVSAGFPSISSLTINPIEIIYVCGYGAASAVPVQIKRAIKLMVTHLYENRDSINIGAGFIQPIPMPKNVRDILADFRVKHFG